MAFREPTQRHVFPLGLDAAGQLGLLVTIASTVLALLGVVLFQRVLFLLVMGGGAAVGIGYLMSGAPRALELDGGTITLRRWGRQPTVFGADAISVQLLPDELVLVTPVGTFDLARRYFRKGELSVCAEVLRRACPHFVEKLVLRPPR